VAKQIPTTEPFLVRENFHCLRMYEPAGDPGTPGVYQIGDGEMATLIEKGMTHHLQPASEGAKAMMPSIDEMTRGDLRAIAEELAIDYTGMNLEQLRRAVKPKKADTKELASMTLEELQTLAMDKGVDPEGLTKKKLIEAIQAAE
jgi:hypothetical protein